MTLWFAVFYTIDTCYILLLAAANCSIPDQRSVWLGAQSVTFDIVSRCFENKNNNCCDAKICKNAICLLFTNLQIHNLATLLPGRPSCRVARNGFVNNKQMAFYKIKFHHNYCFFYFQNIWIQCRMWQIVGPVKQIFGPGIIAMESDLSNCEFMSDLTYPGW